MWLGWNCVWLGLSWLRLCLRRLGFAHRVHQLVHLLHSTNKNSVSCSFSQRMHILPLLVCSGCFPLTLNFHVIHPNTWPPNLMLLASQHISVRLNLGLEHRLRVYCCSDKAGHLQDTAKGA